MSLPSLPAFILAFSVALHSSDVGATPHTGITPEPTLNSLSRDIICERFQYILGTTLPVASASSQPRTVPKQRGRSDVLDTMLHECGFAWTFVLGLGGETLLRVRQIIERGKRE